MDLRDKVAIVTGAGSGIGRATALRLAKEGVRVVVSDLVDHYGHETVGLIADAGGVARFYEGDVTDEKHVSGTIFFAEEQLGGLDIMVNNAGTITPQPRFPDADSARWQLTLDINLRGTILGTYHAIPALKRRGGGVIVNTASIAGLMPYQVDPVYAASKAGVVNFTRSLTYLQEEANIRVNCVCPGVVRTNLAMNSRGTLTHEERAQIERTWSAPEFIQRTLAAEDVAEAFMRLITDDSLNGMAYRIAATSEWELV